MTKRFKATLHREGTALTFRVFEQPEEWRERGVFVARHGGQVRSCACPELSENWVYLRGFTDVCDNDASHERYSTLDQAVDAFYDYDRTLTEFICAAAHEARQATGDGRIAARVRYRGDAPEWRLAVYEVGPDGGR